MNKTSLVGLVSLMALIAPLASAQESTGYCDPQVAKALVESYKARQKDQEDTLNDLLKVVKKVSSDSTQKMSACVGASWPNISFRAPTMDQIIKGVANAAVNKFCGEVRKQTSELNSALTGSYYINTGIPGVPSYGVSSSMSYTGSGVSYNGTPVGGTSTGTGTSTGGNGTGGLFQPTNPRQTPPPQNPPTP